MNSSDTDIKNDTVEDAAELDQASAQETQDQPKGTDDAAAVEGELEQSTEAENLADALTDSDDVSQVEALQEKIGQLEDNIVRNQAELLNVRRRAEQDVSKAHKFALEKFVNDLLPVVDNLDRALASLDESDDSQKAIVEGLELTRKSFIDTLAKHQVEAVDPGGEPFDPNAHQAVSMVPNPDVEPNTVIDVFQKGYLLNGRLIRPAMVVVSTN